MLFDVNDFIKETDMLAGKHTGQVVDINDPLKQGRVKVKTAVLDTLSTTELPWATILQPPSLGGDPTLSYFSIPQLNTKVIIEFLDSRAYTPIIVGYLQDKTTVSPQHQTDYPNTYGFSDPKGLTITTNRKLETVDITHVSGTTVHIAKTGELSITSPANINITPNNTLNINGDTIINGNTTINGNEQINGSVTSTKDMTANNISLINHVHSGVQSGMSNTQKPV